jgi:peptidyl-prolyl cis-trans isomerase D
MLDLMRKNAGSWMIKFVLGAIIVVFAFWGVGTFNASQLTTVATVDDTIITYEAYRDTYNRLLDQVRENFGANLDENLLKAMNLKQAAVDQLINDRLLINEAGRLGLEVTDEELARAIRGVGVFHDEKGFDPDRYRRVLSANRLTPENFEHEQRQALLIGKLRAMVADTVKVGDIEVRQWYDFANAQVSLDVVKIDAQGFKDLSVSEADVQSHYEAHKDDYRTEPKRRVRYVVFEPTSFSHQVVVSDEEVAEYYAANQKTFQQEESVEARHVLIKTAASDTAEAVEAARQKALEVEKKARSGQDFAELARLYSEGPTAANGGLLGRFGRQQMVKPFADKAFSMKAGEISEPVKTEFGWHVIKVERVHPAVTRTLEETAAEIRPRLTVAKAKTLAFEAADSAWDAAYDRSDLEAVAKERRLTLQTTDLFDRSGPVEARIAEKQKFSAAAFALKIGDISDVQEMSDGYYILQVTEEQPARTPELAEISQAVRADALKAKQSEAARQEAENILKAARGGEDLAALATSRGLKVATTGLFGRQGKIAGIGADREMSVAAFRLSASDPWPERVFNVGQDWYVVRLAQRQRPDEAGFAQQKDRIEAQLRQQKQSEAFEALLAHLRRRSEIEIKPDVLDR